MKGVFHLLSKCSYLLESIAYHTTDVGSLKRGETKKISLKTGRFDSTSSEWQPKQLMICEDKSNIIYLKMIAKNIANMKLKDESDLAFAQQ